MVVALVEGEKMFLWPPVSVVKKTLGLGKWFRCVLHVVKHMFNFELGNLQIIQFILVIGQLWKTCAPPINQFGMKMLIIWFTSLFSVILLENVYRILFENIFVATHEWHYSFCWFHHTSRVVSAIPLTNRQTQTENNGRN